MTPLPDDSAADPLAGRMLGPTYQVIRSLAAGGMGLIVEAEHLRLHRRVAVKLLPPRWSKNPGMLARFHREVETLSKLQHAHIVHVLDYDVSDRGEPFLVMELLHGENLSTRLERDGVVPLDETVRIVAEIASGLTAAHEAGVVHRDLTPANVFLEDVRGQRPCVKLLDFGVVLPLHGAARLTSDGMLIGTPSHMAPEIASGASYAASPQSDQYALAVMTYQMLAGRPPFVANDLADLLQQTMEAPAPRLSSVAPWASPALDDVLGRALAKKPEHRFPTAFAFADAVTAAAARARGAAGVTRKIPAQPATVAPASGRDCVVSLRVVECLASARSALLLDEVDAAATLVEEAIDQTDRLGDPVAQSILDVSADFVDEVFQRHLGGLGSQLETCADRATVDPPHSAPLTFLLSRIDNGMTVQEAIDCSGVPQRVALRMLAFLSQHRWVRTRPGPTSLVD